MHNMQSYLYVTHCSYSSKQHTCFTYKRPLIETNNKQKIKLTNLIIRQDLFTQCSSHKSLLDF